MSLVYIKPIDKSKIRVHKVYDNEGKLVSNYLSKTLADKEAKDIDGLVETVWESDRE